MKISRLIPAPLHRLGYRAAHMLRGFWYQTTGKTVHGCTVLARDAEGRFLLVRHSYGPAVWAFPGGGIGRNETPLVAAMREFREELNCKLVDAKRVDLIRESYLGATNVVHVFTGVVEDKPRVDRREIIEARFFERNAFPRNLSRTVASRLRAFDAKSAPVRSRWLSDQL